MDGLDDKDEFQKYMTEEETKAFYSHLLEKHKGHDRVIIHCNKEWWVDLEIPPCIICPECGEAALAVTVKCSVCLCHPCVCGQTSW